MLCFIEVPQGHVCVFPYLTPLDSELFMCVCFSSPDNTEGPCLAFKKNHNSTSLVSVPPLSSRQTFILHFCPHAHESPCLLATASSESEQKECLEFPILSKYEHEGLLKSEGVNL